MPAVLHVVSYFPPDRIGGVGEVVEHVHRALQRNGERSVVLTSGRSESDPSVVRVAATPMGFALGSLRGLRLLQRADIVHAHHGEAVLLLLAARLLRPRLPIVLTLHVGLRPLAASMRPYEFGGRRFGTASYRLRERVVLRLRWWMDLLALRLAHRVTFISRSAARDVLGKVAGGQAEVILNAVGTPESAMSEASAPIELLFVGTNSVRKRVELLPHVLAAVRRQMPNARLRIVGLAKTDNPAVVEVAEELGVDAAIEFAGAMPSGELPRFYRSARVLLVPSRYEGLPMVILEAMREGLPVVATNVSGHPEILEDGVNGALVPVDDPQAMADASVRVLSDPDFALRLAEAARRTVRERFAAEQQVAAYRTLYGELTP